jgi:hypothetical protein
MEHGMNLDKLTSLLLRVLFTGSLLLMSTAVVERIVNFFGYTILPETSYSSGRLLEFAAIFLIVVIALLLRQVRDELKHAHQ